jgi:hypothetical protein
MKRWMKTALALAAVLCIGAGAFRVLRGPSGASVAYGGSVEAAVAPDFPSTDATSWANGAPTTLAALRGSPVILEIWSPT